ncbi:MAG: hypothetical protein ACOCYN_04570 [Planctomycetota bacterium]
MSRLSHVILLLGLATVAVAADDLWPAPVEGHVPIQPGEHPRLLFRASDLPALRARARTPEGQALIARLKEQLGGGETMPSLKNDVTSAYGKSGGPAPRKEEWPIGTYSMSHAAGFGLLYLLTEEQKYADLGRQCFEWAFQGVRDRDREGRYAFKQPGGALRAGPTIGWYALGYDLCYNGWDDAFRQRVAQALAHYNESRHAELEALVNGKRHNPRSNHWGMQVGGGAMTLLAIMHDPGIDMGRIEKLLAASQRAMIRNATEGFGDGGYFAEGDGTGTMASHIIYLTAAQAWRTAAGLDFISPRQNVRWMALKWIFLTVPRAGRLDDLRSCFPERGGYRHNIWARTKGISGGGYFGIGYGAVLPKERAALWWFYNTHLRDHDAQRGTPWDSSPPYPHHTVLAFVNTPFGMDLVDPAEVMPRTVRDGRWQFYAFRNRWQDENDIVISQLLRRTQAYAPHGPDQKMVIWHHGQREQWGSLPSNVQHYRPAADGSAILGGDGRWVGIDFSGASGADGMLVLVGGNAEGQRVAAGGVDYTIRFLGEGGATPTAEGDAVVVGEQRISMVDGTLTFATWAGPWGGATAEVTIAQAPPPAPAEEGKQNEDPQSRLSTQADSETAALFRRWLLARAAEAGAERRKPRFTMPSMRGEFDVDGADTQRGTVALKAGPSSMQFPLERMPAADQAALALALARPGNADDHATAAFFLQAAGERDRAQQHLLRAGERAALVLEAFVGSGE